MVAHTREAGGPHTEYRSFGRWHSSLWLMVVSWD